MFTPPQASFHAYYPTKESCMRFDIKTSPFDETKPFMCIGDASKYQSYYTGAPIIDFTIYKPLPFVRELIY